MSVLSSERAVELTGVPSVNLLPPEIAQAARFRRLQLGMGAVVVLAAAIVGGLYYNAHHQVAGAQASIDQAQSQQTALDARLGTLQTVKATYAAVQAKQATLQVAESGEIKWSYILNDLSLILPNNVWLTAVSASETDPSSASIAAGDSSGSSGSAITTASGIGTLTFAGDGLEHDDLAAFLLAMSHEKGFSAPTFTSSTEQDTTPTTIQFGSSVNLTKAALAATGADGAGQ